MLTRSAVALFATFAATCLVLSLLFIQYFKFADARRGARGDQVVDDDLRWGEGRVVVERKVVFGRPPPSRGAMEVLRDPAVDRLRNGQV